MFKDSAKNPRKYPTEQPKRRNKYKFARKWVSETTDTIFVVFYNVIYHLVITRSTPYYVERGKRCLLELKNISLCEQVANQTLHLPCPGVSASHGWIEGDISEDGNDDEDEGEDK